MDSVSKIGDRIRRLREERKLTQQALADALHVKRETINMWENGLRDLKTGSIILVADFFNVSCDFLLGRVDNKSADVDIQAICQKTGLSESAIETLVELQSNEGPLWNEDDNGAVSPIFENWAERKNVVFKVINYLMTWPVLEEIIFLSEEIAQRLNGQQRPFPAPNTPAREEFDRLKEAAKKVGLESVVLDVFEYDTFKKYEINERSRVIADYLYRLLKYGTVFAPDGKLYFNDTHAFEMAMMEAYKHGKA